MTRIEYLTRLERAGWGDVPQGKIPAHVIAAAENGGEIECRKVRAPAPKPKRRFSVIGRRREFMYIGRRFA